MSLGEKHHEIWIAIPMTDNEPGHSAEIISYYRVATVFAHFRNMTVEHDDVIQTPISIIQPGDNDY